MKLQSLNIFTVEVHYRLEVLLMINARTAILDSVSAPSVIKHSVRILSFLLGELPQGFASHLTKLLNMGEDDVNLDGDTSLCKTRKFTLNLAKTNLKYGSRSNPKQELTTSLKDSSVNMKAENGDGRTSARLSRFSKTLLHSLPSNVCPPW